MPVSSLPPPEGESVFERGRIVQINPEFPKGEFAGALVVVYEDNGDTLVGQIFGAAFDDSEGVHVRIRRSWVADTGGVLPWWPLGWLTKAPAGLTDAPGAPEASRSGETTEPYQTGPAEA